MFSTDIYYLFYVTFGYFFKIDFVAVCNTITLTEINK